MRLRNPRVQLVIALALLLILVSAFSLSKIWLKQGSVNVTDIARTVHIKTP